MDAILRGIDLLLGGPHCRLSQLGVFAVLAEFVLCLGVLAVEGELVGLDPFAFGTDVHLAVFSDRVGGSVDLLELEELIHSRVSGCESFSNIVAICGWRFVKSG